jgi:hypothetical protein
MRKHSETAIDGLAEFRRKFVEGESVTEIEITDDPDAPATFIVVKYRGWTAVINPQAIKGKYLDVDVHAFSGDGAHKARVAGFPYGRSAHLPDGHNYPLSAVIIGEDSE